MLRNLILKLIPRIIRICETPLVPSWFWVRWFTPLNVSIGRNPGQQVVLMEIQPKAFKEHLFQTAGVILIFFRMISFCIFGICYYKLWWVNFDKLLLKNRDGYTLLLMQNVTFSEYVEIWNFWIDFHCAYWWNIRNENFFYWKYWEWKYKYCSRY